MPSDIGIAFEGIMWVLIWGAIIGGIGIPMVLLAMLTQSWIPIFVGFGSTIAICVYIKQRREDSKTKADMKGFPVSPELTKQRFNDYLQSTRKDRSEEEDNNTKTS